MKKLLIGLMFIFFSGCVADSREETLNGKTTIVCLRGYKYITIGFGSSGYMAPLFEEDKPVRCRPRCKHEQIND